MENKRFLLILVALVAGLLSATAQDRTVIQKKNGGKIILTNGVKYSSYIGFWEHRPNADTISFTTTHNNNYTATWEVSAVEHRDGQYGVGIYWRNNVPSAFNPRYGVCFGTKPGLSVEQCDTVVYYSNVLMNEHRLGIDECYMLIGELMLTKLDTKDGKTIGFIYSGDLVNNRIPVALLPGQTYYYRTFTLADIKENYEDKTVCFYDKERSFRVPSVMADAGYAPEPIPSEEAIQAFAQQYFKGYNAPTWAQLRTLWNLWRASDEGKKTDISDIIISKEFDDGTGYQITSMPDAFYTWMANREVVIDAIKNFVDVNKIVNVQGDSILVANWEQITDVASVPGGKYMRFTPTGQGDITVIYASQEVVAGVAYKLIVNFAPETLSTATEQDKLPTVVDIMWLSGKKKGYIDDLVDVPATKASQIEIPVTPTGMGIQLEIKTDVLTSDVIENLQNRILRIAEIRMVPVKKD